MTAEILHAVQANLQLSYLLALLVGTIAGTIIGAPAASEGPPLIPPKPYDLFTG